MTARRPRRVVSRFEDIVSEVPVCYGKRANHADVVAALHRECWGDSPKEVFSVMLLNGRHEVIGVERVSEGTLTMSLVHPREVFGPAVRLAAAAIVVCHHHPSGDPKPSAEDHEVTGRLKRAGLLLGIPLLDHIVVGLTTHVSLREEGYLT